MQIIESSLFGLRAARHVLTSPDTKTTVTLFPMVHVGDDAFYRDVYEDASTHDVMLVEGVRSPVVRILTSSYRWINVAKLGLVVQPRSPREQHGKARVVHADLSTDEFHRSWRQIPLWLRLVVAVAAPIFGLTQRLVASRESIARHLEMDDRLSSDELLSWNPQMAALKRGMLNDRDDHLIRKLSQEIDRRTSDECSIAVVYGAAHMRAVLAELRSRGFRTTGSSWQTVFVFG
jgi:hypothetical protein